MTRKATVLAHLQEHGYITPGIAMLEYGMTNGLAQRVCDLRVDGVNINTRTKTEVLSGNVVTRYELVQ